MINGFGSLYAGYLDIDDIGFQGTPVNDRAFSSAKIASVFRKTEAIAQLMDRVGYKTLWLAEHHFQREGYQCIPNIPMLGLHLASLTEKIKFGCGFNITPIWHPLRLAEDFATVDILTGGRIIFGVGRGYHTREVETFGAPLLDQNANRELFEEQVDIILKAFNEPSFSYHGKYYDIPPKVNYRGYELEEISLVPRPANLPVECWQPIVSGSPRALEFMAKRGIKGLVGGGAATGGKSKVIQNWRDALDREGRQTELGGDLVVGMSFHIARTQNEAFEELRHYYEENLKILAPMGFVPGLSEKQLRAIGDPALAPLAGLPTIEDAVESGGWLCGPPDLIVEQLKELEQAYPGLKQVNVNNLMSMPQTMVLEQLEWFASDVMPAFTRD